MSSSFSTATSNSFAVPVASFLYRDMETPTLIKVKEAKQVESVARGESEIESQLRPSRQEMNDMLNLARIEASAETEKRLIEEFAKTSEAEAAKIRQALELFEEERKSYFGRVESDVVHLALAIAAKIMHREAQVDPLLVSTLVRVAVGKLHDGSSVSLRVPTARADKWRERMANPLNGSTIAIVEDPHLGSDDCILETDVGSANFSIEAQLKEVEQGFFDLLAQRPQVK